MSTEPTLNPNAAIPRTRTALSCLHQGILVPEHTFALPAPDPLLRHKPLPALPSSSSCSSDDSTTIYHSKSRATSKSSRKRHVHRRTPKTSGFDFQLQQLKRSRSRTILPKLDFPVPVRSKHQRQLKASLLSLFRRATTSSYRGSARYTEEEEMEIFRQEYLYDELSHFHDTIDHEFGLRPILFLTPQERETILEKKRLVSQEKVRMVFGEVEAMDKVQGYGFDWLNWMEYKREERMLDCVKDLKGLDRRNACRAALRHCIHDAEDDEYDFCTLIATTYDRIVSIVFLIEPLFLPLFCLLTVENRVAAPSPLQRTFPVNGHYQPINKLCGDVVHPRGKANVSEGSKI